jgi:hypothetical protein
MTPPPPPPERVDMLIGTMCDKLTDCGDVEISADVLFVADIT